MTVVEFFDMAIAIAFLLNVKRATKKSTMKQTFFNNSGHCQEISSVGR